MDASELTQEIERLQFLLRSIGVVTVDCLRPGLTEPQIRSLIERFCPPLAGEYLHEDFLTWFGWQNGVDVEKYEKLDLLPTDTFTPEGIRFSSLESVLETLSMYLEFDGDAHRDNNLLFSDSGGSMYGICPTVTGWRMHFWSRDEPEPVPVPHINHNLAPEQAPTLTELLHTLNTRIEDQQIVLDERGFISSIDKPVRDEYPWIAVETAT